VLSDATLDPVGSDIELAIRVGWLADSALRARRIGTFEKVLVAGPGHAIAPDATPADVAALPFVANSNLGDLLGWTRRSAAGLAQTVRFTTTLAISATIGVLQAARGEAGLAILPDFAVAYDLAAGRLVRLLPDWQLGCGGIHAVMPGTRFRPARVTAFLDIVDERERGR